MRNSTIGTNPPATAKISDSLQDAVLHSIRNVVSDDLIERTCQEVGYQFRRRVADASARLPLTLWRHLFETVSQQA